MEEKRQKQELESGGANIEEIEIKRHEVEGLADQLEPIQVEQKEVFLVIFQVNKIKLCLCMTYLLICLFHGQSAVFKNVSCIKKLWVSNLCGLSFKRFFEIFCLE